MSTTQQTLYDVACPLCGRMCDIRYSRLGNPYFTCPDCGLRCFVNGPIGKQRLYDLAEERVFDA